MHNLVDERPTDELHGRQLMSVRFVKDADLNGARVLDVGCGYGWFVHHALERGAAHVVGTDMTERDIETARTHLQDPRVTFCVGNALAMPGADNEFDCLAAWEVIEHIPRNTESRMFAEARRVLRSGGVFYLSTPHRSFWSNMFDPAWWLIGHRHYRSQELSAFASENGFVTEEVQVRGGWWTVWGAVNMYVAKWLFRRRPFFADRFARGSDAEFERSGFAGLFMRFRKLT